MFILRVKKRSKEKSILLLARRTGRDPAEQSRVREGKESMACPRGEERKKIK
jgi:hypothetical protein